MTIEAARRHQVTAILYLVAALVFLLTSLLGDVAEPAFLVLAMAFVVLAGNEWRSVRRTG